MTFWDTIQFFSFLYSPINSLTIDVCVSMTTNRARSVGLINCSIVMVICLIIERLERIWWHWKRYVERLYFRKLGNTVRPVTWERFFFAQWRRVVKPITYSNSAKLAGSSSTKHHSEKRFFENRQNFSDIFELENLPVLQQKLDENCLRSRKNP